MGQRTIRMTRHEAFRYEICQQLISGELRESEAAERLELSVRQVRRLKKRAQEEGVSGLVHRSRGRASGRRLPSSTREGIVTLYRERYAGWNMTHFSERLSEKHGIEASRETVRGLLQDEASRPRRHQRRRHRRWRERRRRLGELVQLDASIHAWLGEGGEDAVLISAIDDATSRVLWAELFAHDGVLANLTVMKRLVQRHGIPGALYVDQDTTYFLDEAALTAARERGESGLTQFGKVMDRLGVRMIRAHSPQAKGRVERSFGTLQDRLIKELADEGITEIAAANRYLRGTFNPDYNRRFGVEAADATPAFVKPNPPLDYNAIFCLRETRQVRNDHTIPWKGERLQLLRGHGLRSGSRVEVRRWLDGSVHVYFKDEKVRTRRLPKRAS